MSEHLFLAVPLPMELKEKLDQFSKKWHGHLPFKKWTYKDDFHITLAFLGPVTSTKRAELVKQLHVELSNFNRFQLTVTDIGTFGNTKQPRVWWCGISTSNELSECQLKISNVCEALEFSIDKRPYRPHITIAKRFDEQFKKEFEVPISWKEETYAFEVNEITLYKIHPSKKPSYEPIELIKLK